MGKLTFDAEEMERYLQEFDVFCMKYFGTNVPPREFDYSKVMTCMEDVSADGMLHGCSADQLAKVYDVTEKVYGSRVTNNNKRDIESYPTVYKLVLEKFINGFVAIEGVDTLYNPLYFVFEWLMHLEYKENLESYSYYRDHFVHQVRNMVEMLRLLTSEDLQLKDECIWALKNGKNRLAIQMNKTVKDVLKNPEVMTGLKEITECIKKPDEVDPNKYMEMTVYTYILLASAIVTSVCHDIGYPITFISDNLTMMGNFLPASKFFFEKKDSNLELHRILQDSLLYRMYSPKMIADKVREGDHGAISACVLLMKYYENGRIFSLSSIEKMIIELSALTIFEHTLKYENIETGKDRYQISFEENPFSYLFRLCDDMEEWDRTYFEITKQSNFLLCGKCETIIKTIGSDDGKRHYACCCGEKGTNENAFKYRKLANVDTCKKIEFEKYELSEKEYIYRIKLDYDLIALLQAAAYSESFAQKRASALREIKIMTFSQSGLKTMYIDSFITNNPILIKMEILSRYLCVKCPAWDAAILKNALECDDTEKILEYIWNDELYREIMRCISLATQEELQKIQRENMLFYLKLLVLSRVISKKIADKKNQEEIEKEIKKEIKRYLGFLQAKYMVISIALAILVKHALLQRVGFIGIEDFSRDKWKYKKQYFDMYQSSKEVTMAVKSYIAEPVYDYVRIRAYGSEKQKSVIPKGQDNHYDYYSDYGVFQKMYQSL